MVEIVKQNYEDNIKLFNKIKSELIKILGKEYLINHVGSTAIPNMLGKNIIDILIGVNNQKEIVDVRNKLMEHNYYLGNHQNNYSFLASSKKETKSGDIHIHIAIIHQKKYHDFLILKKYLLDNPTIAHNYSNYKIDIINKYGYERNKYRSIKSKYVHKLIKEARLSLINKLPKKIIFIRHGENIVDDYLNNDLLSLSDIGIKQAKKAKERLKDQFDIVISSPSLRAIDTAKIIGNQYIVDNNLLEKGYGNNYHGDEPIELLYSRINNIFNNLTCYTNKRVLIVTHGSLIRLLQNIIEENNNKKAHINNCDIVIYENINGKYVLINEI